MSQHIANVNSTCFNIEKSNPPLLTIHSIGSTNSTGWKNPKLTQQTYLTQPTDGIQDFDFYAEPPTDKVLWVMSPVSAETTIVLESWIKGVRIKAATNSVVVRLSEISCSVAKESLSDHVLLNNLEPNYQKLPYDGVGGQESPPDNPPAAPTGTKGK